jgi:hypothetical protein
MTYYMSEENFMRRKQTGPAEPINPAPTPWDEAEQEYAADPLLRRVVCDPNYRGGKPYLREAG